MLQRLAKAYLSWRGQEFEPSSDQWRRLREYVKATADSVNPGACPDALRILRYMNRLEEECLTY